jgi:hypothetical protein
MEDFFNLMNSTTFVLFDKYCPIVDQLGSKDSSRDFELNCVIRYFFTYIQYSMQAAKNCPRLLQSLWWCQWVSVREKDRGEKNKFINSVKL